ncbi:MAG: RES family NAD+ phosphorylase [Catalinimonas sp.]
MTKRVADHPLPPEGFRELPIAPTPLREGETIWRITPSEYQSSPLHYGTSGAYRFDDPNGAFGVCYLDLEPFGAFLETFARVPRDFNFFVTTEALRKRVALGVSVEEKLNLFDITGRNLARIGADNRLSSGADYAVSQAWSRAVHEHPSRFDGILYVSRHDPEQECVALFGRAKDKVRVSFFQPLNGRPFENTLGEIMTRYAIGLG